MDIDKQVFFRDAVVHGLQFLAKNLQEDFFVVIQECDHIITCQAEE